MPHPLHLSASAIATFKACPTRFKFAYVDGLRPAVDTESQRVGTNWHAMHEAYHAAAQTGDENTRPADTAIYVALEQAYTNMPSHFDATAWAVEKEILRSSFLAYLDRWQEDAVETLATEVGFELPLNDPTTGEPLPVDQVVRVGKIDRIVRRAGFIGIADYKTTSEDIAPDSDYWSHLRLDTQINMYCLAARELDLSEFGVTDDEPVAGAFYDVWRKPTIRPSKLTQAETAKFCMDGEYCGATFTVANDGGAILVDGVRAEVEQGKKGFAIRETPAMYGARLRADIKEQPARYFARREIPRTDADIERFRAQLWVTYQAMIHSRDNDFWIENERSCRDPYPCAYLGWCTNGYKPAPGETPPGFRRLTHLTVNGETP